MDEKETRKNRLDLEYHGESQKANAFLILLTTGILSFLGTFFWLKDNKLFLYGATITLVVSALGGFFYRKSSKRMSEILNEVGNI